MQIDLEKFFSRDLTIPEDVIELTSEEADVYEGKDCFKIKGTRTVIHIKNCKHNKPSLDTMDLNTLDSVFTFTDLTLTYTRPNIIGSGRISDLGQFFGNYVNWLRSNGYEIITYQNGRYVIIRR